MSERLWNDVEAFLAAESVELDDLDLKGGGKARILKVTVDAEGDLGLGRITDLARGLSHLLDENPTDMTSLAEGFITVTALVPDMTDHRKTSELQKIEW